MPGWIVSLLSLIRREGESKGGEAATYTTYHFTITIAAAPDLPPIPYYIELKLHIGGGPWGPGITINVEE